MKKALLSHSIVTSATVLAGVLMVQAAALADGRGTVTQETTVTKKCEIFYSQEKLRFTLVSKMRRSYSNKILNPTLEAKFGDSRCVAKALKSTPKPMSCEEAALEIQCPE